MDSQPASMKNFNDVFFPDFNEVKADKRSDERDGLPPNVEFMLSLPATKDSKISEVTIFKETTVGVKTEEKQLIHWDESVQLELYEEKSKKQKGKLHNLEGNKNVIEVVHMGSVIGKDKMFFFRWPKSHVTYEYKRFLHHVQTNIDVKKSYSLNSLDNHFHHVVNGALDAEFSGKLPTTSDLMDSILEKIKNIKVEYMYKTGSDSGSNNGSGSDSHEKLAESITRFLARIHEKFWKFDVATIPDLKNVFDKYKEKDKMLSIATKITDEYNEKIRKIPISPLFENNDIVQMRGEVYEATRWFARSTGPIGLVNLDGDDFSELNVCERYEVLEVSDNAIYEGTEMIGKYRLLKVKNKKSQEIKDVICPFMERSPIAFYAYDDFVEGSGDVENAMSDIRVDLSLTSWLQPRLELELFKLRDKLRTTASEGEVASLTVPVARILYMRLPSKYVLFIYAAAVIQTFVYAFAVSAAIDNRPSDDVSWKITMIYLCFVAPISATGVVLGCYIPADVQDLRSYRDKAERTMKRAVDAIKSLPDALVKAKKDELGQMGTAFKWIKDRSFERFQKLAKEFDSSMKEFSSDSRDSLGTALVDFFLMTSKSEEWENKRNKAQQGEQLLQALAGAIRSELTRCGRRDQKVTVSVPDKETNTNMKYSLKYTELISFLKYCNWREENDRSSALVELKSTQLEDEIDMVENDLNEAFNDSTKAQEDIKMECVRRLNHIYEERTLPSCCVSEATNVQKEENYCMAKTRTCLRNIRERCEISSLKLLFSMLNIFTFALALSIAAIGLDSDCGDRRDCANYVSAVFPFHFILICAFFGVAFAATKKDDAMKQLGDCAQDFAVKMANVMLCLTSRIPRQKSADLVDSLVLCLDSDEDKTLQVIVSWLKDATTRVRAFNHICDVIKRDLSNVKTNLFPDLFTKQCEGRSGSCKHHKIAHNNFCWDWSNDKSLWTKYSPTCRNCSGGKKKNSQGGFREEEFTKIRVERAPERLGNGKLEKDFENSVVVLGLDLDPPIDCGAFMLFQEPPNGRADSTELLRAMRYIYDCMDEEDKEEEIWSIFRILINK